LRLHRSVVVVLAGAVEVALFPLQSKKLEHVLLGGLDAGPLDGLGLACPLQIIFDQVGRIAVIFVGELASTGVTDVGLLPGTVKYP
jgi:hypothetical protein